MYNPRKQSYKIDNRDVTDSMGTLNNKANTFINNKTLLL